MLLNVLNSAGLPNTSARVTVYLNPNFTGQVDQGVTNSLGQVTLNNLPVNSVGNPTATSRTFYFQALSANHLPFPLSGTQAFSGTTDIQTIVNVPMNEHRITWANSNDNVTATVGYTSVLHARAWYEGYQGAGISDITTGPNPATFLSQSVTAGGYPGSYSWSGWDPAIISVTNGSSPDRKNILGIAAGNTTITVTATYNISWNGTPFTLTKTRAYNVTCVLNGTVLTIAMTPDITTIVPNGSQTFMIVPTVTPSDISYTWAANGDGLRDFTPVNASGNPVPNGSNAAKYCLVRSGPTLMNQITVTATASSEVISQNSTLSKTLTVNYAPLAVTLTPGAPVATQPGYSTAFTATATGGSGAYSYTWSTVNPTTADLDNVIGSITNTTGRNTTFTALQIGSVNVMMHVVDPNSGRFIDSATLMQVQPAGGVTGGGE